MEIGVIYRDSWGRHPLAAQSWCGPAEWKSTSFDHFPESDGPGVVLQFQALLASVPESLRRKVSAGLASRASMQFLPWATSGVGVVTLVAGDDALVAFMDIAGRKDLHHLLLADVEGCVKLTACAIDALEMCPSVPVVGAGAAVQEAERRRRLSGREFQEVVEAVRWLLRSNSAFPLLGAEPRELSSLTINVVQPLEGRSATLLTQSAGRNSPTR